MPSHIAKARFLVCVIILKHKKNIIEKEHLQKNTLIFWKNLGLNMIKDTFLNPSNDLMAHPYGMRPISAWFLPNGFPYGKSQRRHRIQFFYRTVFPTGKANVATGFNFSSERFTHQEKPMLQRDTFYPPNGFPYGKSQRRHRIQFFSERFTHQEKPMLQRDTFYPPSVFPTGKADVTTRFIFIIPYRFQTEIASIP